ncbi:DegT/DnrJ/EryC1/StrS family aminotransferase [Shimia sagamensis]|uniref:dTDP-4-amino-4,6-dideoxygalactose transaminase n=1 Tax=Shimia sagamensis TaxID=1566352 RepID=A0ABY1PG85_9RHOB|nr:aminotransferase class I/II-fold pyridoxal phosphate-dependent enzyme [Shimia sagamensis]SMP33671.1 dTDP-4-amino-4,6-dideoxygalactose transaminase [Shimia sagamensis]
MSEDFTGNFTQQLPISEEAIQAAVSVMRGGRLHRYNLTEGEIGEVSLLEQEFAAYVGSNFCLAVASGGYALACALRAMDVKPGDRVLTNAFTLAPVPGAIASIGAVPVFVGVTEGLVIDLADLEVKADQADVLMLSHMRGHICDMEALMAICDAHGVTVIEDCAHTMGGGWKGVPSGRHGAMACYSTQTYKHINSGEGGFLISDDETLMARAVMLSGSYMLYERHGAAPSPEIFEGVKYHTPNVSGRMDHLRAAILRPQLRELDAQVVAWNERHDILLSGLQGTPGLTVVERPEDEAYVGSSIQMVLLDWPEEQINEVLTRCGKRGVELKWFGGAEPVAFTSRYDSWRYAPSEAMPKTDRILKGIVDMRIPLTFSEADCALIARIIRDEVSAVFQAG